MTETYSHLLTIGSWLKLHPICPNCGVNFADMHPEANLAQHYLGGCRVQTDAAVTDEPEGFWENWGVCEWASVVGIALCIVTMVGISCFGWFQ